MQAARELGAGVYRQGAFRYSPGPSFVQPCKLAAEVYRHAAPPVLVRAEFADPLQTRGRSVLARIASVLMGPEFTPAMQTRGRIVPGAWCPLCGPYSSSDQFSLSSRSSSWKIEMYFSRVLLMMESATESSYA